MFRLRAVVDTKQRVEMLGKENIDIYFAYLIISFFFARSLLRLIINRRMSFFMHEEFTRCSSKEYAEAPDEIETNSKLISRGKILMVSLDNSLYHRTRA